MKTKHTVDTVAYRNVKLAERVGFEPTCPLRDKTLSRRPRYDHFGTSPLGRPNCKFTVSGGRAKSSAGIGAESS